MRQGEWAADNVYTDTISDSATKKQIDTPPKKKTPTIHVKERSNDTVGRELLSTINAIATPTFLNIIIIIIDMLTGPGHLWHTSKR